MTIPTLPTDNLYKFMAIFGLTLFLFSIIFPLIQYEKLELKSIDVIGEYNILGIKLEEILKEVKSLEDEVKTDFREIYGDSLYAEFVQIYEKGDINAFEEFMLSLRDLTNKDVINIQKADTSTIKYFMERGLKAKAKLQAYMIESQKAKTASEEFKALSTQSKRWITMCIIGTSIGWVAIFYGFGLWYVRLQKPLDLLLKNQLEEKKLVSAKKIKKKDSK